MIPFTQQPRIVATTRPGALLPLWSTASPPSHPDTASLGLVWWYGGKQGSW